MNSFQMLKQKSEEHNIVVIAEFNNTDDSLNKIAELSDYISEVTADSILTDLQKHPAGYRITYTIKYIAKTKLAVKYKVKYYSQYLSRLSSWLYKDSSCISKYYYSIN